MLNMAKWVVTTSKHFRRQTRRDHTEWYSGFDRIISPLLDQIKPDPFPEQYFLEVTSLAVERPLKTKEALEGAVGKYVNISLYKAVEKQKVFEGTW